MVKDSTVTYCHIESNTEEGVIIVPDMWDFSLFNAIQASFPSFTMSSCNSAFSILKDSTVTYCRIERSPGMSDHAHPFLV